MRRCAPGRRRLWRSAADPLRRLRTLAISNTAATTSRVHRRPGAAVTDASSKPVRRCRSQSAGDARATAGERGGAIALVDLARAHARLRRRFFKAPADAPSSQPPRRRRVGARAAHPTTRAARPTPHFCANVLDEFVRALLPRSTSRRAGRPVGSTPLRVRTVFFRAVMKPPATTSCVLRLPRVSIPLSPRTPESRSK